MERIAVFGGIYSNYLALAAALDDVRRRGVDAIYCLGDLGAFGPHPDRVFPLLRDHGVLCIQGNYDNSIGHDRADCQCGYTDPRDNHFARRSYAYTLANTTGPHRAWMRDLPLERRILLGNQRLLLCHGSPRRMNEFLWESTTSTHFLDHLVGAHDTDVILATHTGIKWQRALANGHRFVNVGVLGRPENDGTPRVWYTILSVGCVQRTSAAQETCALHAPYPELNVEFVPVDYDHERLAQEMEAENLPAEFCATIRTGWWTTCLEILPAKERRRGKW